MYSANILGSFLYLWTVPIRSNIIFTASILNLLKIKMSACNRLGYVEMGDVKI